MRVASSLLGVTSPLISIWNLPDSSLKPAAARFAFQPVSENHDLNQVQVSSKDRGQRDDVMQHAELSLAIQKARSQHIE
jgi:hypothetical protein